MGANSVGLMTVATALPGWFAKGTGHTTDSARETTDSGPSPVGTPTWLATEVPPSARLDTPESLRPFSVSEEPA